MLFTPLAFSMCSLCMLLLCWPCSDPHHRISDSEADSYSHSVSLNKKLPNPSPILPLYCPGIAHPFVMAPCRLWQDSHGTGAGQTDRESGHGQGACGRPDGQQEPAGSLCLHLQPRRVCVAAWPPYPGKLLHLTLKALQCRQCQWLYRSCSRTYLAPEP